MQNHDREKRAREKLFVVIVVAFNDKKTLSKSLFNSSKHTFSQALKLFNTAILFDKKRKKELFDSNKKKERFREFDIKYFDSHYFEAFDKDDLIVIDDKTYYRNVWLFIDSIKSIATRKIFKLIRSNFQRCFRDDAQIWYIVELKFLHRDDFNTNHNIAKWAKALNERFKMNESKVMQLLIDDKYTIDDVKQKQSIISYVQSVIRHAKNTNFNTIHTQLTWTWNHLALDLQRDISTFNVNTTKLNFIKQLENIQQIWKRYYVVEISSKKRWDTQRNQTSSNQIAQYQSSNQNYSNDKNEYNNQTYSLNSQNNYQSNYQTNNQENWDRQNRQNTQSRYFIYS